MEETENIVFRDRVLKCLDCGCSFTFHSGEQSFFYSKGLSEPKRCAECRELRKRTIAPGRGNDER